MRVVRDRPSMRSIGAATPPARMEAANQGTSRRPSGVPPDAVSRRPSQSSVSPAPEPR